MPLPLPTIEVPSTPPMRRAGLLDAAVGPLPMADTHMRTAGGQWESESCTKSRLYPNACRDVPYDAFVYDPRESFRAIYPYNVFASEICTPVGTSLTEAHRRVRARLDLGLQTAVETALWGSATANVTSVFQQMNTAALVTVTAASATPTEAVSLLEQQASDLGDGPIFLHARPRMAAYLAKNGLIDEGPIAPSVPTGLRDLKRTHMGSTYVFGAGYKGTSPDNATAPDATKEYMFATGRVFVWLADVVDAPPDGVDATLNRVNNQRTVFAYRSVGISVECYAAATQVTR